MALQTGSEIVNEKSGLGPVTRWDTTDTERLRTLASGGLNLPEIANEMERSNNAIRFWAKKAEYCNRQISTSRMKNARKPNDRPPASKGRSLDV
jgi:hypothetical protein